MFLKVEALPYIQMESLSIGKLKPEKKVNLAIQMTDVCVRICADAVKDRHPSVKDEELIELVRERINYRKRHKREV
jgi:hypothetical protein